MAASKRPEDAWTGLLIIMEIISHITGSFSEHDAFGGASAWSLGKGTRWDGRLVGSSQGDQVKRSPQGPSTLLPAAPRGLLLLYSDLAQANPHTYFHKASQPCRCGRATATRTGKTSNMGRHFPSAGFLSRCLGRANPGNIVQKDKVIPASRNFPQSAAAYLGSGFNDVRSALIRFLAAACQKDQS
ncbi:hypothetical protein BU24DRAFT_461834 [Aaosphaeria arxii CBS 175.79]|uniref:Uncharacterized protein n=1 Tax=Aaosphaeria arxii CBS 175.79 TaxID=1450172 RepID=A0A6A5XRS5_9PLEO|nr:uncharacterized protein BU24DRAFT_461834 [Aaosphaeria arxii CBS 175.79]KAF2015596.1 hypothetical protein BU24DRAFT_461834 [Aaosphaeria arxii CBS 175.79]